jgi:lysophospholipase L1-like esterase
MDDACGHFALVVDGAVEWLQTEPGERDYEVARGLSAGEHTVELYRRPESSQGITTVSAVEVDGELLPPPIPSRRIAIIGDSITCGYGNEGADRNCGFSAETENHYQTYGAIAARTLQAELMTTCWSGRGMVCNYGDDADSCSEPFPAIYDEILPGEAALWDYSSWQPQLVVINLGTNDFSTASDPTSGEFTTAYTEFLTRVREDYPTAQVLCGVGPLLDSTDSDTVMASIRSAIAAREAAGDSMVGEIDLTLESVDYGCDWHPKVSSHEQMAEQVVEAARLALGW